jgi:hypothetical protein
LQQRIAGSDIAISAEGAADLYLYTYLLFYCSYASSVNRYIDVLIVVVVVSIVIIIIVVFVISILVIVVVINILLMCMYFSGSDWVVAGCAYTSEAAAMMRVSDIPTAVVVAGSNCRW